jgi:hypothetical protein
MKFKTKWIGTVDKTGIITNVIYIS